MVKQNNHRQLFYDIIVLILVLIGSNSLISQNVLSTQLSIILNLLLLGATVVFSSRKTIRKQGLVYVCVLASSLILTMIINVDSENLGGYFVIVIQIFATLLLAMVFERGSVIKSFVRVVFLIAVFSLIVTYVLPIFSLEKYLPVIHNSTGLVFYYFGFAAKLGIGGAYSLRNYGIFSEPAVYCFYLFFAMLIEITNENTYWKRAIVVTVLAFTSFTTISPIGLISSGVFMSLLCLNTIQQRQFYYLIFLALLVAVAVFLILYVGDFKDAFRMVLDKATLDDGSGEARKSVLLSNLQSSQQTLLFGGGLKTIVAITETYGFNTSTTGVLLSGFGLILTVIVGWLHFLMIRQMIPKSLPMRVIVFILFMLVINNFSFLQNGWFWIFTLYGVLFRNSEPRVNSEGKRLDSRKRI